VSCVGLWRWLIARLAMWPLLPRWFRQNPETLAQTRLLDARIIVQLYRP